MGLFSRRKKQDDVVGASAPAEDVTASAAAPQETPHDEAAEPVADVPAVNVSVQAFRGLGAPAGPAVDAPAESPEPGHDLIDPIGDETPVVPATVSGIPSGRPPLPLAPADPPEPTESIPGMPDNVLLREALAMLGEDPSQAELLGVLRQSLQGNLFLQRARQCRRADQRGQATGGRGRQRRRELVHAGLQLRRGRARLGAAEQEDPSATSAVVQPVQAVFQNVVEGPFAGLIIDNASAPHRVVFPAEVLQKALEEADPGFTIKALLAAPREADSEARVAEALLAARLWVAVSDADGDGQFGVAEAHTANGERYLQLFSHPLEVIALGRGDQPLPFSAEQVGAVIAQHPDMTGVLIDAAGPAITVHRDALGALVAIVPAE